MLGSLAVGRFSALKGLPIVARGKGVERPLPRVWVATQWPLPPQSPHEKSKALPTRGRGGGEWGTMTNLSTASFHPVYPVGWGERWFSFRNSHR